MSQVVFTKEKLTEKGVFAGTPAGEKDGFIGRVGWERFGRELVRVRRDGFGRQGIGRRWSGMERDVGERERDIYIYMPLDYFWAHFLANLGLAFLYCGYLHGALGLC